MGKRKDARDVEISGDTNVSRLRIAELAQEPERLVGYQWFLNGKPVPGQTNAQYTGPGFTEDTNTISCEVTITGTNIEKD